MAKLVFVFLIVVCLVQVALSTRVVRDAPVPESSGGSVIDSTIDSVKKGIDDTFSKDNLDKIMSSLSAFGTKLKEIGTDIATKIEEKTKTIGNKEE